jgi:ankyrin repeat protein
MVALLLDNGANIKCVDYYGGSILHSTHIGYVPSVNFFEQFINRGADIGHRDKEGQTPLLSIFQEIIDSESYYRF